jgi:ureidoglycolate lyase
MSHSPPALMIEYLTRDRFAPFGDVIETAGAHHFPINGGTTERYHDLAGVDVASKGGRALISVFRGQPRALPFEVSLMERHPLGSQAFLPLDAPPYLIVVAPTGDFDPVGLRAFVTRGWQGVNYARGVWHHPLLALDRISDFIVIDRGGDGANCDEITLANPVQLTREALERAV